MKRKTVFVIGESLAGVTLLILFCALFGENFWNVFSAVGLAALVVFSLLLLFIALGEKQKLPGPGWNARYARMTNRFLLKLQSVYRSFGRTQRNAEVPCGISFFSRLSRLFGSGYLFQMESGGNSVIGVIRIPHGLGPQGVYLTPAYAQTQDPGSLRLAADPQGASFSAHAFRLHLGEDRTLRLSADGTEDFWFAEKAGGRAIRTREATVFPGCMIRVGGIWLQYKRNK